MRSILHSGFITDHRDVLSAVFDLSVISVGHLNGRVGCMLNGLIISDGFGNFHMFADGGDVVFDIFAFVRHAFIIDVCFIVSVIFLDWNVFHVDFGRGTAENGQVGASGLTNHLRRAKDLRAGQRRRGHHRHFRRSDVRHKL